MYLHNDKLLIEMAEIGRIDGYRIMIYGCEGHIPHFHVENKEKEIFSCVKILESSYFIHNKYTDTLDNKTVKKLVQFLNEPHKFFGKHGYNNWQIICVYWNDNNPDFQIKENIENLKMPDYSKLR